MLRELLKKLTNHHFKVSERRCQDSSEPLQA